MAGGGQLRFTTPEDGTGVRIVDAIERKRVEIDTGRPVSPNPYPTDKFAAPVDAAASIGPSKLRYDYGPLVYVRDSSGTLESNITSGTTAELPYDSYVLETIMPVKVYLRIQGAMTISVDIDSTEIDLKNAEQVAIGARSLHKRPAGTIETTERPRDIRRAISILSSSLKTTSPERSFPTLRGHPPRIELGESLRIPSGIERPETGIQLEVPDDIPSMFEAAPLAFYLGAELTSGPTSRLVTKSGWERLLGADRPFQEDIERVLQQVVLLDSIVRTEGLYPVNLHERNVLEPNIDLDLESLYDMTIADRIERYLTIPFDSLEPHIPRWKTTAHLSPDPEQISVLPFALDDLALVRVASPGVSQRENDPVASSGAPLEDPLFRSLSEFGDSEELVEVSTTDSLEDRWYGDGIPLNGSKGSLRAHLNRLDRRPNEDSISVAVVLNDPDMAAEGPIEAIYGADTDLPFAVSRHRDLSQADLTDLLEDQYDFLHFIGHVTTEGLQCAEGFLDTQTLDTVGVDAFLLNACQSYAQGRGLIEAGAIGGVVTINDVVNTEAVTMGRTLARLLNGGFHLEAALDVASVETVIGDLYTVLGDSGVQITQTESGSPYVIEFTRRDGRFSARFVTYPSTQSGMGSLIYPSPSENDRQYLLSGPIDFGQLPLSEIRDLLSLENQPFRIDGQLHWTGDLELADIR